MNWIREKRIENNLTQMDLTVMANYELSLMDSEHRVSQSRLSTLERLNRINLLSSMYVIEYKAIKRIFDELEGINSIGRGAKITT